MLRTSSVLQRVNLKTHAGQVTQYPGINFSHIGCSDAGYRTRVDRLCPIMTVRNDAGFHGVVVTWRYPVLAVTVNI